MTELEENLESMKQTNAALIKRLEVADRLAEAVRKIQKQIGDLTCPKCGAIRSASYVCPICDSKTETTPKKRLKMFHAYPLDTHSHKCC